MDTSKLKYSSSTIYSLFANGFISTKNLVNLSNDEINFVYTDWDWYLVPRDKKLMMNGVKNILYLEWDDQLWIPFRKVPKISFKFRITNQVSKIRGIC
jgi:hypothetical protein